MNIKRAIAIAILLSLLLTALIFQFSVFTSYACSFPQPPSVTPTESIFIDSVPPMTEPQKPVIIEPVVNTSITYIQCDNKAEINAEMEKCINYRNQLMKSPVPGGIKEIKRINKIIDKYEYDLKFIDKTIIPVPEKYQKRDFKSYEPYTAIKSKISPHYKLQREYAYTNEENGIRMVNDRYCIALGSYFVYRIGQYVDVVLANGVIIKCILGDQKADAHTDNLHIAHKTDGSIIEFIVDKNKLPKYPRIRGNLSYLCEEWQSPVAQIIVYEVNVFDE